MIASIGKFSKSFLAKVLVGIIALPFILWGMGDVFRSGNQNVIAEINDTKIGTKDFMNYLQSVKITNDEIYDENAKKNWDNKLMSPDRAMHELSKCIPDNTLIVNDGISHRGSIMQYIKFNKSDEMISGRGGSIGWGVGLDRFYEGNSKGNSEGNSGGNSERNYGGNS